MKIKTCCLPVELREEIQTELAVLSEGADLRTIDTWAETIVVPDVAVKLHVTIRVTMDFTVEGKEFS